MKLILKICNGSNYITCICDRLKWIFKSLDKFMNYKKKLKLNWFIII